jgi:hypothetical protein
MASGITESELSAAVRLLKKSSSINAVSSFLKRRGLTYSAGSWDDLVDNRLKRALADDKLTRKDILQLLIESEEFGHQHVFLFKCPKSEASALLSESEIRGRLSKMDIEDLFLKPRKVEMPKGLVLVDVRFEVSGNRTSLVIKGVNVRRKKFLVGTESTGNREIITYEWEEDRAVTVLRVSSNGLTEVRVQSYQNAVNYVQEAEDLFAKCAGIVDRFSFGDFSLARARLYMIRERKSLTKTVRFGENSLRSKKGAALRLSTGNWTANMFDDDDELDGSVESFLAKGKGRSNCDTVNCTWLKSVGTAEITADIHTYIGGANNEFVIIPQCERSDYEYVLEKITSFSK